MQFDYEIPVDEYTAAQVLFYKASAKGQLVKRTIIWALLGLFFVFVALFRWAVDWPPILLLLTGALFTYWSLVNLFPGHRFRRHYPESGLAGKRYHAEMDENGLFVSGDGCSWRMQWSEIRLKAEDERVFMLCGKSTIFSFGKKYLSDEQRQQIRQLAVIP